MSLFQPVSGTDEEKDIYKRFSPDLLISSSSTNAIAAARQKAALGEKFSTTLFPPCKSASLPRRSETEDVSNIDYFGKPVYTYSLKQGFEDGFLAPYKVIRIDFGRDIQGWRPQAGQLGKHGNPIEDRIYNQKDMDRRLVLEERGFLFVELAEQVGKDFDPFGLVCHVAFEQPPLTRREQAENVKKRNYFAKYGEIRHVSFWKPCWSSMRTRELKRLNPSTY